MTNFEVTANKPMASLDEAASYFKKGVPEHLDKNREITVVAIAVVEGRLKVIEGFPR